MFNSIRVLFTLILFSTFALADVFMTELTDPQDSSTAGRYVELHNNGDSDVDLSTWALQRWTNGNTDPQSPVSLTGTISAGGFYVICNDADKYFAAYGLTCDQDIGTGGAADSNGDDNIALLDGSGAIIDMFGVPGEDGTGTPHEFEDGRAERAADNTSASATWDEAGWNIDNDSGGGDGAQYSDGGAFDPAAWIGASNDVVVDPCEECMDGCVTYVMANYGYSQDDADAWCASTSDAGNGCGTTCGSDDSDEDGSGDDSAVAGCIDTNATNYDPTATEQSYNDYGTSTCTYASCADIPVAEACFFADGTSSPWNDGWWNCLEWGGSVCGLAEVVFELNLPSGTAGTPHVNGSYNGWCGSCYNNMSDDDGDGTWSHTQYFSAGESHEYKFTIDGWSAQEDLTELGCAIQVGSYWNRTFTAGDANTSQTLTFCYGTCDTECPTVIEGCTDGTALNFDENATDDDGSCFYEWPEAANLFFSEAAEGSSNNKYLEIYNASDSDVDLSGYSLSSCSNGCDEVGAWDYADNVTFDATVAAGDVYVVCHGSADDTIQAECDQTFTYLSNGDDVFALTQIGSGLVLDAIGIVGDDPGSGFDVAGIAAGTKDHTLVRKAGIASGNPLWLDNPDTGELGSAGTDADSSEWVVLDQNTWDYLGSHPHEFSSPADYTVEVLAMSFAPADLSIEIGQTVEWVWVEGFHNVNGSQSIFPNNPEGFQSELGSDFTFSFTFNLAGHYDYQCDPHAGMGMVGTITVGTGGCMDESACNYDANADFSDDSCSYIADGACDCDGNVLDCNGDCGGAAVEDCAGTCGGSSIADDCGTCWSPYCYDMGTHIPDYMTTEEACNEAGLMWVGPGGAGGMDPTWNTAMDECGVCDGNGIPFGACDCAGTMPVEHFDCDGNCTAPIDCNGECGGMAMEDECGVCEGDGSTCIDPGCTVNEIEFLDLPNQNWPDLDNSNVILGAMMTCQDNGFSTPEEIAWCIEWWYGWGVLGSDCLGCYGELGQCQLEDCAIFCTDGWEAGDACDVCMESTCMDSFTTCSGIDYGCDVESACNYVEGANMDAQNCVFAIPNFDCDGNCIADIDCAGTCGGTAVIDCNGECGTGLVEDCFGECGGTAIEDCFGECGGAATEDCAGICNGDAVLDECGICNGPGAVYECGCSNIDLGACDCAGTMPVEHFDCDGNCVAIIDCAGVCGGGAVEDECGVCDGDNICWDTFDCDPNNTGTYVTCPVGSDYVCAPTEADCFVGGCDGTTGVPDCDGSMTCCPAGWVGDGWADCSEQWFGCDLSCYDNDGGDCEEDSGAYSWLCPDSGVYYPFEDSCNNNCTDACLQNFTVAANDNLGSNPDRIPFTAPEVNNQSREECEFVVGSDADCAGQCFGELVEDECGVCEGPGIPDGACDCEGTFPGDNFDCDGNCLVETDCNGECGGTAVDDECGVCGGDGSSCDFKAFISLSSNGDVLYTSSEDIYGFQFAVVGTNATVTGASGGASEASGFSLSVGGEGVILGFSFSGAFIPAGSGVLTSLDFEGDGDVCLGSLIVSGPGGSNIISEIGDGTTEPGDASDDCTILDICTPGDVTGDNDVSIMDIVSIVAGILGPDYYEECADIDGDGSVNIMDVVAIVQIILNPRESGASSAVMYKTGDTLNISGDGFIGAVQMTLSHGSDFSINLTDDALVSDYVTDNNTTTLIIVVPDNEEIFTATGDYDIDEVIVVNDSMAIDVVEPGSFTLEAAYPNPFNPSTSLNLNMPVEGYVSVKAYNLAGQVVGVIAEGSMDAGTHTMTWDASSLSSGVYLITAEYAGSVATQKVMLMK